MSHTLTVTTTAAKDTATAIAPMCVCARARASDTRMCVRGPVWVTGCMYVSIRFRAESTTNNKIAEMKHTSVHNTRTQTNRFRPHPYPPNKQNTHDCLLEKGQVEGQVHD